MKGVVFNLLEEAITNHHGEEAWDRLLDAAGLDGSYTSLGSYKDEELEQLVAAAAEAFGSTPPEMLRWFAREAMSLLAVRYTMFFTPHRSARPFIESVNSIIHPEVRKLYTGAHCPHFDFTEAPDGALLMGYRSPRKLCMLAQGFIEGAALHYGETADVSHLQCVQKGDPLCRLRIMLS